MTSRSPVGVVNETKSHTPLTIFTDTLDLSSVALRKETPQYEFATATSETGKSFDEKVPDGGEAVRSKKEIDKALQTLLCEICSYSCKCQMHVSDEQQEIGECANEEDEKMDTREDEEHSDESDMVLTLEEQYAKLNEEAVSSLFSARPSRGAKQRIFYDDG